MSAWKSKVVVREGETTKHIASKTKGFVGETDIDTYDIVDSHGQRNGTVTVEVHTAVRGFKKTISVEQRDMTGAIIVDETWNP